MSWLVYEHRGEGVGGNIVPRTRVKGEALYMGNIAGRSSVNESRVKAGGHHFAVCKYIKSTYCIP